MEARYYIRRSGSFDYKTVAFKSYYLLSLIFLETVGKRIQNYRSH